jgi:hypothetical protein
MMRRAVRFGIAAFTIALVFDAIPIALCSDRDANKTVGKGFATPQEAIAAYRHAIAKKEWSTAFLCFSPASRGTILFEMLFVTGMNENPQFVAAIEKHTHEKWRDAANAILAPTERQINGHRVQDRRVLYETFAKRVIDVPAFVQEFCRQIERQGHAPFEDHGDVTEIKLEGDRAIAYGSPQSIVGPSVTSSKPAQGDPPTEPYLSSPFDKPPRARIDLCKIDGTWYLGFREEQIDLPNPPPSAENVPATR